MIEGRNKVVLIATLAVCLAMVSSAQAADVTWVGNVDNVWDTSTANWAGGASVYTEGDDVYIDDTATSSLLQPTDNWAPNSVWVDISTNYELNFNNAPNGQGALNVTGTFTKTGVGTLTIDPRGGAWSGGPYTTSYIIQEGTLATVHWDENGTSALGNGATVELAGGTLFHNDQPYANKFRYNDITVTADSNLTVQRSSSSGWADSTDLLISNANTTLTITTNSGDFYLDNEWQVSLDDDLIGKIVMNDDLHLMNDSVLTVTATGTQTPLTTYVLVDYTGSTLTGQFASFSVPAGWDLDYAYDDGNKIAMVPFVLATRDGSYSYWNVDGDGTWATNANWDPNTGYPNAAGVKIRFANASSTQIDENTKTITLPTGETRVGEIYVEKAGYTITGDGSATLVFAGSSPAVITLKADADLFQAAGYLVRLDSDLIIDNQVERTYTIDLKSGGAGWDSNGFDIIIRSDFGGGYGGHDNPSVKLLNAPADANVIVEFSTPGHIWMVGDRPNTITLGDGVYMEAWNNHVHQTYNLTRIIIKAGGRFAAGYERTPSTVAFTITGDGTGSGALTNGGGFFGYAAGVDLDGNAEIGVGTRVRIQGLGGAGDLTVSGSSVLRLNQPGTLVGDIDMGSVDLIVKNSSGTATGTGTVTISAGSYLGGDGSVDDLVLAGEVRPGALDDPGNSNAWKSNPTYRDAGSLTANNVTFLEGASYLWELKEAASVAGVDYDLLNVSGTLTLTDANWTLDVDTVAAGAAGNANGFNASTSYVWQVVATDSLVGFDANKVTLDLTGFSNPGAATNLFDFREQTGVEANGLYLTYTAEELRAIANGNWDVDTTWDLTKAPEAHSTTYLENYTVTVDSTEAVALKVVVDAGDHLKINAAADLSVGFQMDTTDGELTVDGTLTVVDLTIGGTTNVGNGATIAATGTLTVTNSSSLNMSGASLDISSTSQVTIDTSSSLTVDQSVLTVGGNLTIDGTMTMDGTIATIASGTLTIGGTAIVNINGESAGFDLGSGASLVFTGSVMDLDFDFQDGGGEYWGLRWEGQHVTAFTDWLSDGNITTGGAQTAGLMVGYDGTFTAIGFNLVPYTGPLDIGAMLTFDANGTGDLGYTHNGANNFKSGSGITDAVYELEGTDGNIMFVRNVDSTFVLDTDAIDASDYTNLQLSVDLAGKPGSIDVSGTEFLEFSADIGDGNGFEVFARFDANSVSDAFSYNGVDLTIEMTEWILDLPAWADDSNSVAIRVNMSLVSSTNDEQVGADNLRLIGIPMEELKAIFDANWNDSNTWDLDKVPSNISAVLINNKTVTVANAGQVAKHVTIDTDDALIIEAGASLAVAGQLNLSGTGTLTVDGALTGPGGTFNIGSTITVGAAGSVSASNINFSSNNTIDTGATITATSSFSVTGSSSLDMTSSELDVSTASLTIGTGSSLTVDQLTLAVGGATIVDGALVLDGTTLQANGGLTVGGTINASIGDTSGGIEVTGDLTFTGSSINLEFNGNPDGNYYGLRVLGNKVAQLTGWLDAGTHEGDGHITATAPGPMSIHSLNVGFDGTYSYIGFGTWPVPAAPGNLLSLTFDANGSGDIGYVLSGGQDDDSGVHTNYYGMNGINGNYLCSRDPDPAAVITLDAVDATGYTDLSLSVGMVAGGGTGYDNGQDYYTFHYDVDDGNGPVEFFAFWPASGVLVGDDGNTITDTMSEFVLYLPEAAEGASSLVIIVESYNSTTSEVMGMDDLILIGTPPAGGAGGIMPFMDGDVNGDGNVDTQDISPFVAALLADDEADFLEDYPDGLYWAADVNEDGNVDTQDITPFVDAILGTGTEVPEPATMALLGIGALAVVVRRRRRQQAPKVLSEVEG